MYAQLALRGLDGDVRLPGRDVEALGHQLEVVDERLHRGAHDLADVVQAVAHAIASDGQLGRPGDLLVLDHDRALARLGALQLGRGLLDDLERLIHLVDADPQPTVGVTRVAHRHIELIVLITAVRVGLAQVVRQTGRAQHRPGDPQSHATGQVQIPDVDHAPLDQRVLVEQPLELADAPADQRNGVTNLVDGAPGQILGNTARADVGMVHPQAGDHLEDGQDALALTEADRHDGGRAHLHATGGQAHEVGCDAVELHHHHPDGGGALGDLVGDTQQLLDAKAVGRLVEQRGQVVHPGAERHALGPVAELHVLLDTGVQVSDAGPGLGDVLAVKLEDEAQDAMGRRVLRTHVDNDPLLMEGERLVGDAVPVAADSVVDVSTLSLLGVGHRGGVDVAILSSHHLHDPISCTTCADPEAGWWRPCTPPGCRRGDSPCAAGGPASRPASGSASGPGVRRTRCRTCPRSRAHASRWPDRPQRWTGCGSHRQGR